MICHVCKQPAIGLCKECFKFYCEGHGNETCVACATSRASVNPAVNRVNSNPTPLKVSSPGDTIITIPEKTTISPIESALDDSIAKRSNEIIATLKGISIKTPRDSGGYWKGIPHDEILIAMVQQIERRAGWRLSDIITSITEDNADIAIILGIIIPRFTEALGPRHELTFAVVNSNAKRFALRAYIGIRLRETGICVIMETLATMRKHTKSAKVYNVAWDFFNRYEQNIPNIILLLRELEGRELDGDEVRNLLETVP
jgi:hypothetical protein